MRRDHITSLLLPLTLAACSDSAAPTPGRFNAQLSGARNAALSGDAYTERNFVEEYPDHHFVIHMNARSGDTVHSIALRCRGDIPPESGSHTLSASGEDCFGNYFRIVQPTEGPAILRDAAEVASGDLTVARPERDQLPGTFSFSGHLLADGDTLGTLQASGSFSADET